MSASGMQAAEEARQQTLVISQIVAAGAHPAGSPTPTMSFARGSEVIDGRPPVQTESPIPAQAVMDRVNDMDHLEGSQQELRHPDAGFPMTEELEANLDKQCVPNEHLEDCKLKESKVLRQCDGTSALPPQVRDMCLRFMSHFVMLMNLPQPCWFQAAELLDVVAARWGPGALPTLPATCIALVKLLKKADQATLSMKGSNLSVHAVQLTQWLQRAGVPVKDVTEEMLCDHELPLCEVLDWQLNPPTIETWMSLFCTRFNVLTRGDWLPSLNWIWEQSIFSQRMLVMHMAANRNCPPQLQAAGLLGLSFVLARLVPMDMIRPAKYSAEDWERLFLQSQLQCTSVPECVLQSSHSERVLQRLEVTTEIPLLGIKEACETTALLLSSAVASMRQMQGAQAQQMAQGSVRTPTVHHTHV